MRLPRGFVLPLLLATLAPGPILGQTAPAAVPAPAGSAPADPSPAEATPSGLVYVLNSGEANILVLDATTREEVRRIPVLREVHHLALTPDGGTLMIGDSGANEMLFLNPATGEMVKREPLSNPYHLGFSPDGRHLVITSLRRDQVDLYSWDGQALALQARLRMPDMPSHIAFSPDSKLAYITLQGNNLLTAIDLQTREAVWKLDVGPQPAGVIWHEGKLLVGIMGRDHVAVVNPETRQVERRIKVGRGAHAIFPAPPREGKPGLLYVTSRVDSRITVLDPATLETVKVLDVPGGPDCVSFDPQGRLWVTQRWIGRVAVVDPETSTLENQPVGRSPHGVLFQPTAAPMPVAASFPASPASSPAPAASGVGLVAPAAAAEAPPAEAVPPTPASAPSRRLFAPRTH
jgi:DNA-binding beta-propeller fold protein YncE